MADFCAPFNLSVKTGGAKLALCQHWQQPGHTSLTSSAHTVPSSFNLRYIGEHFATKVAQKQGKGAGKRKR
jgi:hypothetical protein